MIYLYYVCCVWRVLASKMDALNIFIAKDRVFVLKLKNDEKLNNNTHEFLFPSLSVASPNTPQHRPRKNNTSFVKRF